MRTDRPSRIELPLFFVLAYAITWSVQIPVYLHAHRRGVGMTNEDNAHHLAALFRGELDPGFTAVLLLVHLAFGPTVAGVVVTGLFHGRAGLADLWRRAVRVRIPGRWAAIVLALPLALSGAAVLLGWVLGGFAPVRWDFLVPLSWAVPFLLYMTVFTGLAEEVG